MTGVVKHDAKLHTQAWKRCFCDKKDIGQRYINIASGDIFSRKYVTRNRFVGSAYLTQLVKGYSLAAASNLRVAAEYGATSVHTGLLRLRLGCSDQEPAEQENSMKIRAKCANMEAFFGLID